MIAKGLLRHRFHGTYSAIVLLAFETPEAASAAHPVLGALFEVTSQPRVLCAVMTAEGLEAFKAQHASRLAIEPCTYRHCHPRSKTPEGPCKARDIDALTHSVDNGPRFTFNAGAVLTPPPVRKPRTRRAKAPALEPIACSREGCYLAVTDDEGTCTVHGKPGVSA